jgi:hypothetical protein
MSAIVLRPFPICLAINQEKDNGTMAFMHFYAGSKIIFCPVLRLLLFMQLMRIQLTKLAHARSGDKGDTANVGLIALKDEYYPLLVREVTAERVKQHFGGICKGEVERFELPNLSALNFLLHESLDGGGTLSLMTDAQGKTFSTALLRMRIELADAEASKLQLQVMSDE